MDLLAVVDQNASELSCSCSFERYCSLCYECKRLFTLDEAAEMSLSVCLSLAVDASTTLLTLT